MPPSANICTAVTAIRLGEEVNSALTQPSPTATSQNVRNMSTAAKPSRAFSWRCHNDRAGGAARLAAVATGCWVSSFMSRHHAGAHGLLLDQSPHAPLEILEDGLVLEIETARRRQIHIDHSLD